MERGDGRAGEDQIQVQVQVLREAAAAAYSYGARAAARCVWLGLQARWFPFVC